MTDAADAAVIVDIAERLFAAICAGDVAAVEALYADDVVVWHNTDRVEQNGADNLRVLGWLVRSVADLRYEDVRRHVVDGGFVQQHVLRGTTAAGAPLDVAGCLVVRVRDGLITRIDEYLDSAALAPLFR